MTYMQWVEFVVSQFTWDWVARDPHSQPRTFCGVLKDNRKVWVEVEIYGAMIRVVINQYQDEPFQHWHTSFEVDGMHLNLIPWVREIVFASK